MKYPKVLFEYLQEIVKSEVCTLHNKSAKLSMLAFPGKLEIECCCKDFHRKVENIISNARIEYLKKEAQKRMR